MNPRIIKVISKGYKQKADDMDHLMWIMGMYVESAVLVAVDKALNGKKAVSKYFDKPICEQDSDSKVETKNKESKEQVAVYEMNQRINLLKKKGLPERPI